MLPVLYFSLQKEDEIVLTKKQAISDIKKGRVNILTFGLGGQSPEEIKLCRKYGFRQIAAGCVVGYTPDEKEYDDLANQFLNKRNGIGWRASFYRELDSILKLRGEKYTKTN